MPGAHEWLEAFWELSTDRQIGMSAGPIPSASIDAWADRRGMDDGERALFRSCIRAMDHEWQSAAQGGEQDTISEHPLTPERFTAMFGGQ